MIDSTCVTDQTALFDGFQIQQVMLNLVMNAIDAAGSGGCITLGCVPNGHSALELFVENSGDSVPIEVMPRIFEPFFTTKPRGTGLGLAIARNIARAHGGDLETDRESSWTRTFYADTARSSGIRHAAYGQGGIVNRILVVEDEAGMRRILTVLFEKDGHEVLEAGSVKQGLAVLTAQPLDLMITDQRLPDGDGLSFWPRPRT